MGDGEDRHTETQSLTYNHARTRCQFPMGLSPRRTGTAEPFPLVGSGSHLPSLCWHSARIGCEPTQSHVADQSDFTGFDEPFIQPDNLQVWRDASKSSSSERSSCLFDPR